MPAFDDIFTNHAIHAQIESIDEKFDEIDFDELDEEDSEEIRRIQMIVGALAEWLERTDPAFVALPTLDNLNSYLSEISNQLTNFISNSNSVHLTNATSQLDQILVTWHQLYAPRKTSDLQGIKQSAISYRNSLEKEFDHAKGTIDDSLTEVQAQMVGLEARFEKLLTQITETDAEISSQKKRLDDAIAEFQKQFSKAQDANRKTFEKEKETRDSADGKRKAQFDVLLNNGRQRIDAFASDFKEKGEKFLQDIEGYEKEMDAMLGIVSEKVITNDYKTRATEENRRSVFWLSASGVVFAGFIGWAIFVFYTVLKDDSVSYPRLISKIAVTIVIGIVAKWTTTQASIHREEERRSHRLALALATISPYLKDMDESQQNEIKGRLSERLFGRIDDPALKTKAETANEFTALKTVTDLVHNLADIFQKKV